MSEIRQQNQHIGGADHLLVYIARWPQRPGRDDEPRPSQVMWRNYGSYDYLPPKIARAFAAALVTAADQIEQAGRGGALTQPDPLRSDLDQPEAH